MRWWWALAGGLLVMCSARGAIRAAEDPEALIHQGIELRRSGDDVRAEGYFRRAYDLTHTPRSAAQLGLVEFALNKFAEANVYLSEALSTDDSWVNQQREIVESSRDQVRSHLASVRIVGGSGAPTYSLGSRGRQTVPSDGTIWLAPGPQILELRNGVRSMSVTLTLRAGEKRTLTLPESSRTAANQRGTGRT